jgi:hypothetical protein
MVMKLKRRIPGSNENWSIDDPGIKRQDKAGTDHPDEGLNTSDDGTIPANSLPDNPPKRRRGHS